MATITSTCHWIGRRKCPALVVLLHLETLGDFPDPDVAFMLGLSHQNVNRAKMEPHYSHAFSFTLK